jgi:hypothetical protein
MEQQEGKKSILFVVVGIVPTPTANIGKASIYGTRREEGLRVRKLYRCMC